ncbi:hypothetical protein JTE90_016901 [Oedothorax gibbosus]|uniref:Uncharacterized protein n=1 Tax=Oedothorax gibbosus TaxID=931172 RepID=A0AAV6TK43_9ARAC|nr:hypothetical protein JTE90_016901 [Oedothorax gibbosus]
MFRLYLTRTNGPPIVIKADTDLLNFQFNDIQRDYISPWTLNSFSYPDNSIPQDAIAYSIRGIDQVLPLAARIIMDLNKPVACVDTATFYALINALPKEFDLGYIHPSRIDFSDLYNPVEVGRNVLQQLEKEQERCDRLNDDDDDVVILDE